MENANDKIRVLIIDSSIECREFLSKAIQITTDMELVSTAPNGNIGHVKAMELKPDVILLDATINDYNLQTFTESISKNLAYCGIILTLNSNTKTEKSNEVILALESGAFDIFLKPENKSTIDYQYIQRRLIIKIREYSIKKYSKMAKEVTHLDKKEGSKKIDQQISHYTNKVESSFQVIVIGVSTGGPRALSQIIPQLPSTFPVPIVVVIHLPEAFTASMARELDKKASLKVVEAKTGDALVSGKIFLARGGKHMVIAKNSPYGFEIGYIDDPPVNNCKPSVDVLMKSVAENFGNKSIGIILTGMGNDGAQGIYAMKQRGAVTIAQDRETSVVWGMPGSAVQLNCVDQVLPLEKIMLYIMQTI